MNSNYEMPCKFCATRYASFKISEIRHGRHGHGAGLGN